MREHRINEDWNGEMLLFAFRRDAVTMLWPSIILYSSHKFIYLWWITISLYFVYYTLLTNTKPLHAEENIELDLYREWVLVSLTCGYQRNDGILNENLHRKPQKLYLVVLVEFFNKILLCYLGITLLLQGKFFFVQKELPRYGNGVMREILRFAWWNLYSLCTMSGYYIFRLWNTLLEHQTF